MIEEITIVHIEAYAPSFPGPLLEMAMASIAAGNTAGRFWIATEPEQTPLLLLWDQGNNVFDLSGPSVSEAIRDELARLITTDIRLAALCERAAYFKARALSPAAEAALPRLFDGIELRPRDERFYGLGQAAPAGVPVPGVNDLRLMPIDRALLMRENLANLEHLRSEIRWMWSTEERFAEHGWGSAALVGNTLACWCTAEYVSDEMCGIGIETAPAFQGRGIATATAARFVEECSRRGVRPYWECAASNVASVRVAEKVGFTLLEAARYWVGTFAPA